MFHRTISAEIEELALGYPVITIIGPRQSGKTTLSKQVFPKKPYANLENPETRAFALQDLKHF
jgi:uncharacterized protein